MNFHTAGLARVLPQICDDVSAVLGRRQANAHRRTRYHCDWILKPAIECLGIPDNSGLLQGTCVVEISNAPRFPSEEIAMLGPDAIGIQRMAGPALRSVDFRPPGGNAGGRLRSGVEGRR